MENVISLPQNMEYVEQFARGFTEQFILTPMVQNVNIDTIDRECGKYISSLFSYFTSNEIKEFKRNVISNLTRKGLYYVGIEYESVGSYPKLATQ